MSSSSARVSGQLRRRSWIRVAVFFRETATAMPASSSVTLEVPALPSATASSGGDMGIPVSLNPSTTGSRTVQAHLAHLTIPQKTVPPRLAPQPRIRRRRVMMMRSRLQHRRATSWLPTPMIPYSTLPWEVELRKRQTSKCQPCSQGPPRVLGCSAPLFLGAGKWRASLSSSTTREAEAFLMV